MSAGSCQVCGRATEGGRPACSTGCDLARRLPWGEGALPASWQLAILLAWGFALFNQCLFAGMAALAQLRGESAAMGNFLLASYACGGIALLASAWLFALAKPKGISDALLVLVALGLAWRGAWFLGNLPGEGWPFVFAFFNLLFVLWLTRGLWRLVAVKKRRNR